MSAELSVIIPYFNRSESVIRAVASVISAAAGRPVDIIAVNDGGDAPTRALADLEADRVSIRQLQHSTNLGPAAARNTGIAAAQTELVSFLDSDDLLLPDTLPARIDQARELIADNPYAISGCAWIDVDADGNRIRTRHPRPSARPEDFHAGCWFSPGSCIIVSADMFSNSGMIFDPNLRRLEDYDLFMRLSARHPLEFHASSLIGTLVETGGKRSSALVHHAADVLRQSLAAPDVPPPSAKAGSAFLDYEEAKYFIEDGHFLRGAMSLARSFWRRPRTQLYPGPGWDFIKP